MREGYKKTEIGIIPEDWEVKKMKEIILSTELGTNSLGNEINTGLRLLKMGNLTRGGFNFDKLERISIDESDINQQYRLEYGDFLFNTRNTLELVGKSAAWKNNMEDIIFNSNIMRIKYNNNVNTFYASYYFESDLGWRKLKSIATGTTSVAAIYTKDLNNVKVILPPLKEQEKIAEILSTVDSQIDDTEKLIEKSKELKKGLMQNLLTKGIGHSEFKKTEVGEIPASWKVKRLGELIYIKSGSSPSKFNLSEEGQYPFFKVDDMNYGFKYLNNSKLYFNSNNTNLMKSGMIIFPKRGASIFTNKILILNKDGYFDTNIMGLICKEYINNEFLYYSLYYYELSKIADTSSIPQINNKHIEPLNIALPPIEEQEKIVQILSSMDNELEEYESKKQKLEKLKKGLMQQLLIGKIRVFNNK